MQEPARFGLGPGERIPRSALERPSQRVLREPQAACLSDQWACS